MNMKLETNFKLEIIPDNISEFLVEIFDIR